MNKLSNIQKFFFKMVSLDFSQCRHHIEFYSVENKVVRDTLTVFRKTCTLCNFHKLRCWLYLKCLPYQLHIQQLTIYYNIKKDSI